MITLRKTQSLGFLFVFLLILSINAQMVMGFSEGYFIPPLYDTNPYIVYSPESNITVRTNYTVSYRSLETAPTSFELWIPYLSNISTGIGDQQRFSQIAQVMNITRPVNTTNSSHDPTDIYGNAYDYFEKIMQGSDQSFYLQYQYETTLRGQIWTIPDSLTLADYDNTTQFYQFNTAGNPYSQVDDPLIKSTVTSILQGETKLASITQAIYEYVITHLTYKLENQVLTAKEALQGGEGDCSEFSTLMVCLLRAAGIPARKMLGVALVEGNISAASPRYNLKINDTWSYSSNSSLEWPGHAWVQYYIPTLGWISADPTWGQGLNSQSKSIGLEYYNRMDYLHLATSIGDWYGEGIDPPLYLPPGSESGIPEFPFIYPVGNSSHYEISMEMDFLVINATIGAVYTGINLQSLFLLLGSGGGLILFIVCVIFLIRRRQKRY